MFFENTCDSEKYSILAECEYEPPSAELYQFTGKLVVRNKTFALNANQILLKGSYLRNTDWIVGYCIYTGLDTRLMMNSQKVRHKQSKVESKMNALIIYILIVQIVIAAILAIIGSFWYKNQQQDSQSYLPYDFVLGVQGTITFFSYFLLMNTLIPISLVVSLEVVKVCQGLFIMGDAKIYAIDRDKHAKVTSMSIIEELGQVDYIFSDKTGTLTRNVMEFKFLSVG